MNSQIEADDVPDERPLRVILFGGNFAALDDAELMGISASGPGCLRALAETLSHMGHADRQIAVYRAGVCIGRQLVRDAANG